MAPGAAAWTRPSAGSRFSSLPAAGVGGRLRTSVGERKEQACHVLELIGGDRNRRERVTGGDRAAGACEADSDLVVAVADVGRWTGDRVTQIGQQRAVRRGAARVVETLLASGQIEQRRLGLSAPRLA